MLKISDLPHDITPRQIQEVAQEQYSLLLQNDEEFRLLQERDMADMMNEDYDGSHYLARKEEIDKNRQDYLDLLDQLKALYEKAVSEA